MPHRTLFKYLTAEAFVAAVFLVLAFVGIQLWADARMRGALDRNRDETLTNRSLGNQIDEKSARIEQHQADQLRQSRENAAMLRQVLDRLPATRAVNP